VTITFVKEGGSRFAFLVIELTNAMVQDMSIGASDARASEEVSFTFQSIKLTDIGQDPTTGKGGGITIINCDVKSLRC
jgi:type VI protein secretion system component Hcp